MADEKETPQDEQVIETGKGESPIELCEDCQAAVVEAEGDENNEGVPPTLCKDCEAKVSAGIETVESPLVGKKKTEKPEVPKATTSAAVEDIFDKLENGTLKIGSEIEFVREVQIKPYDVVKTFGRAISNGTSASESVRGIFCGIIRNDHGSVLVILSKTSPLAYLAGDNKNEQVPILELGRDGEDITISWEMNIL